MQTLVYIIGGYCLIKAIITEGLVWYSALVGDSHEEQVVSAWSVTAFLFLAAIEAFNQ